MPSVDAAAAEKCPVDHTSREKWLEAARARNQEPEPPKPLPSPTTNTPNPKSGKQLRKPYRYRELDLAAERHAKELMEVHSDILKILHQHGQSRYSLDTRSWEPLLRPEPFLKYSPIPSLVLNRIPSNSLSTSREISSIPRAPPTNHDRQHLNSAEYAALPANSETDTGHDRESGNWIYPSQEMFFAAMKRKGHDAQTADMATIVPIHNAVNERAWAEIKAWEKDRGSEGCGGPKLVSFSGDSKALTPRARWKSFVGYQAPFDRHDWVVDRCGKRVDYVIDFYSGKDEGMPGKSLNFFLDVRPKLNTWEGIKTRVLRAVGM